MINPKPDCQQECRFQIIGQRSTLMGWNQVYDKHGNPVGSDPNTVTQEMYCQTCNRHFDVKTTRGESTVIEYELRT